MVSLVELDKEIRSRLERNFSDATIELSVDGNHAAISIRSEQFADLNRVEQQKLVYRCLNDLIKDGRLHAVRLRTLLPEENPGN